MKKLILLLASLALVASGLSIVPAAAAEPGATEGVVPEAPNVVDDVDDANGGALPVTFTGMDVLAGWLTHDATNVYMHIQTTTNVRAESTTFQTNVGTAAGLDCIQLRMTTAGDLNDSFSAINSTGDCGDVATTKFGPLLEEEGPEGTAILTGTFPREGLPMLADGAVLTEPDILVGFYGQSNPAAGGSRIGTIDDTEVGTDYSIASGTPGKTPPGKNPVPGKKKGCDKGSGKKRGCEGKGKKSPKPGKPAAKCAPFTPGEAGAEAKTVVVTDTAAEDKPVEEVLTFGEAIPFESTSTNFVNIQVDSTAKEAGLYAYIDFMPRNDYDLNLMHPDGSYAAQSHGFNPLIEINDVPLPVIGPFSSTGHGGESTDHSEKLVGINTADCGGWTLDVTNFAGPGGDVTLQLWLGDIKNDPSPEGEVVP